MCASLPRIIGLLGRSRSGKDTFAHLLRIHLRQEADYKVQRLSTPIKQAASMLYGFSWDQIEHKKEEVDPRWGITPREVFQHLTETTMQKMGHDFFSKSLFGDFDRGIALSSHIIIPDVRYPHDLQWIRDRNGIVIKIEREDLPVKHKCEDHIDQLEGDLKVENNGTIFDLNEKAAEVSAKITPKKT